MEDNVYKYKFKLPKFLYVVFILLMGIMMPISSMVETSYAGESATITGGPKIPYGANFTNDFSASFKGNNLHGVCTQPNQYTPFTHSIARSIEPGSNSIANAALKVWLFAQDYGVHGDKRQAAAKKALMSGGNYSPTVACHLIVANAYHGQRVAAAFGGRGELRKALVAQSKVIAFASKLSDIKMKSFYIKIDGAQDIFGGYIWKSDTPVVHPPSEHHEASTDQKCYQEPLSKKGKVSITIYKNATDADATMGNPAYDLSQAQFTISGPGASQTKGLDGNSVTFDNLPGGTYTITETRFGKNFAQTPTSTTVTVEPNEATGVHKHCDDAYKHHVEDRKYWDPNKYNPDTKKNGDYVYVHKEWDEKVADAFDDYTWSVDGQDDVYDGPDIPDEMIPVNSDFGMLMNTPDYTDFHLQKTVTDNYAGISKANNNYNYEGAEYLLTPTWTSSLNNAAFNTTDSQGNSSAKLVTDSSGRASLSHIPYGTYKLVEIKAPKGFSLDPTPKTVDLSGPGAADINYTIKNKPFYDPVSLILSKFDDRQYRLNNHSTHPQGDMTLEGAIFKLNFYENDSLTAEEAKSASPLFSFEFKTTNTPNGTVAKLNSDSIIASSWQHKGGVSLSEMMKNESTFRFPLGTYTIQEVKAPTGYDTRQVAFTSKDGNYDNMYVGHITLNDVPDGARGLQTIEVTNQIPDNIKALEKTFITGRVKVSKHDDRTHNITPQGDAKLKSTFEVINRSPEAIFVGDTKFEPGQVVETMTTDDNTREVTSKSLLPYGTYELKEISTDESYNMNPYSKTFSIRKEGQLEDFTPDDRAAKNSVKRGGLVLQKYTMDFLQARPEGDGTLEGAEFTIINKSKESVYHPDKEEFYRPNQVVAVIKTDKNGVAKTLPNLLPWGTYEVYETKPSKGYLLNTSWRKEFQIRADGQIVNLTEMPKLTDPFDIKVNELKDKKAVAEDIIRGGVTLVKSDKDRILKHPEGDEQRPQGDTTLAGAEFTITNKSEWPVKVDGKEYAVGEVVKTITTDSKGVAHTANDTLPYGTYLIKESKAPDGYFVDNDWSSTIEIRNDRQIVVANTTHNNPVKEQVFRGGLILQKYTMDFLQARPEGDGTLAGAEFTIVNRSKEDVFHPTEDTLYHPGEVVAVIKTDEKGIAKTLPNLLPYGTYEVYETKPSKGYLLNTHWRKIFEIRSDKQIVHLDDMPNLTDDFDIKLNDLHDKKAVAEDIIRGGVTMVKSDKDRILTDPHGDEQDPQGDTTLAGAEFTITNKSLHPVKVDGKEYPVGAIVKTIVTDSKGVAHTDNDTLPYGTYLLKESKAPDGYFIDTSWSSTIEIRENRKIVVANTTDLNPVKEQIYRSGVKIRKFDKERSTSSTRPQGDATLKGAIYDIYNDSKTSVYVEGKWHDPGTVCASLTTGIDGYVTSKADLLPWGSYHIIERTPSEGYLLNTAYRADFKVRADNYIYDLTKSDPAPEQVIRGDVLIKKYDNELNKSEAIAGKGHKPSPYGATLEGVEFSIKNISKDDVFVDGTLYHPGDVVKKIYAKYDDSRHAYIAKTVNRTLPYGTYEIYESNTNKTYNLTDTKHRIFSIREDGKTYEADNDGHEMIFKNNVIRGDMNFAKIAENKDPMSTVWLLENVTTGEKHILVANEKGQFSTSAIKHSQNTNANDNLIDIANSGKEIPIASVHRDSGIWFGVAEDNDIAKVDDNLGALPYGAYKLTELKSDSNHFYDKKQFVFFIEKDGKDLDLGTITNIRHEISTHAINNETGLQMGSAKRASVTRDRVDYRNFIIGNKYTLKARLMDAETNTPILNGKGEEVKGETKFRAPSTHGSIDVLLNADGLSLAGKTVVVFEDAYDDSGKLVASHKDITDKGQSVTYPKIRTTAIGNETADHDGPSNRVTTITDRVYYHKLIPGKEYTMSGVLMDKSTGKVFLSAAGREVRSTVKFTPELPDGFVELKFEVDGRRLEDKTLVAFETCKYKNVPVAVHTNIEDHDQSVHFPKIRTTATSELTRDHDAEVSKHTIIHDKVKYWNLIPGKEYALKATLMNRKTNTPLLDANGKEVHAAKTFIAPDKDGEAIVTFEFDASKSAGAETVAFEKLIKEGVELATHTEINDEGQTVRIPKIGTTALYKDTDLHEGLANKEEKVTIYDSVRYFNLIPGKEYTMKGVLMDKDSKSPALDGDGKEIRGEITFTPSEQSGVVKIPFTFNASILEGKTVVAFEDLYRNGKKLVVHNDINDHDQSVNFPKIRTSLVDKETNKKQVLADANITLTDTVKYNNLTPGVKYNMVGRIMVKSTGKVLPSSKVVNFEFTPKEPDGVVRLDFKISTKDLAGESLVAFEKLYRVEGNVIVAIHENINDHGQTVKIPKIGTQAHSLDTNSKVGQIKADNKLEDIVKFENLIPGKVYTMKGWLVDKNGKAIKDKDGSLVETSADFIPKTENGIVKIQFKFDSNPLAGKDVVAFENLISDKFIIARHENPKDENQTVHYPVIGTKAAFISGYKEGYANDDVEIVDKVEYKNLEVGHTYTVVGRLADKTTGKYLTTNEVKLIKNKEENFIDKVKNVFKENDTYEEGGVIYAKREFVAKDRDGEIDVHFKFDGSKLEGRTFVIHEDLVKDRKVIASHKDNNDRHQTVYFPRIRTTLVDKTTGLHESRQSEETVLVDRVEYNNLIIGNIYKMHGRLMDKKTGKPVIIDGKFIETEKVFKAKSVNGTVDIEFKFDSTKLSGYNLVAFEDLYRDKELIATHHDITDYKQTVAIPKIHTTAVDANTSTHQMRKDKTDTVRVVDTVYYKGLIAGKKYTMSGKLIDKSTGEGFLDINGHEITGEVTFISEGEGYVKIPFEFTSKNLDGKTLVAFETLTNTDENGKKYIIAEHKDINDKEQSVHMMSLKTYATSLDMVSKRIEMRDDAKVVDAITYHNLVPNEEYRVESSLRDAVTGEVLKMKNGKDSIIVSSMVPDDYDGTYKVTLEANTLDYKGRTLVVTQRVFDKNGNLVGSHEDLQDEDEQVVVKDITFVNSGVRSMMIPLSIIIGICVICGAIALLFYRRYRA